MLEGCALCLETDPNPDGQPANLITAMTLIVAAFNSKSVLTSRFMNLNSLRVSFRHRYLAS